MDLRRPPSRPLPGPVPAPSAPHQLWAAPHGPLQQGPQPGAGGDCTLSGGAELCAVCKEADRVQVAHLAVRATGEARGRPGRLGMALDLNWVCAIIGFYNLDFQEVR